jgi:excisionase family DNA binding protein
MIAEQKPQTPGSGGDRLLSVDDLSTYLGVPVKTLYQWRHKGLGPRGLRVGRHLRYRRQDVDSWLDGLDDGRRAVPWRC